MWKSSEVWDGAMSAFREVTKNHSAEQQFRELTESLPQLIWTAEADGRCAYLSRQWTEYTGIPEGPQLGFGWLQQIHPEDRERIMAAWRRAVQSGSLFDVEVRIRRHDGSYRWFKTRAVPVRDSAGRIVTWVGSSTDIDDQKRAEESLRRSEATLAQAGDMAHLGAWDIEISNQDNLNTNPLRWSEEVYRIFGYEPGSVAVSNELFLERVHPEDRQLVSDMLAQAIAKKQTYTVEYRIVRPDGTERIVLEHAQITFDEHDRPVQITGAVQDITERKRAEAERERLLEESEEKQRLLSRIIDQAPALISVVDKDMRWRYVGAREAALHGLRPEEMVGRYVWDTIPRFEHDFRPIVDRVLAGETIQLDPLRTITKGGTERFWRLFCEPVRGDNGQILGMLSMSIDVTELTELDRLKDQFITVAAHELKTPLTIMKGYAQTLLRGSADLSPTHHRMLEAINRGTERIHDIVKDLLDISQLQHGELELEEESVNLAELIEQVGNQLAMLAPNHHLQVVSAQPVVIRGDRDRLTQVLNHLVDNAVRYSPQGGEIDLAVEVQGKEAIVSVADHGVGIPKAGQSRIFQRFYRAHQETPHDYGGIGVGLYISKEIISRHGGRMWFESEEGKGTTFYFALPLS